MTYSGARIQKMCVCYGGRIDQADVRNYLAQHFDLVDFGVYSATNQYYYTSYAQTVKDEAITYGRTIKTIGYYDSIFTTSSNVGDPTDSPWNQDLFKNHYSWFLHQNASTTIVKKSGYTDLYCMNWQTPYSGTTDGSAIIPRMAATLISTSAFDGIFFDDYWVDPDYFDGYWTVVPSSWEESMANWETYSYNFANTFRNHINSVVPDGSNKILMPNVVDGTHLDEIASYTGYVFYEHFAHKVDDSLSTESRNTAAIITQIGYVRNVANNDDYIAVFAGCTDGTTAQQLQLAKFCYACFTFGLVDPNKAYFAWQYMGDTPTTNPCWFSFMDMDLGYPINEYSEVAGTTDVYFRTFDNFYVIANLSSLGDAAETFSLSTITGKSINLTLDARDAYFLPRKNYFVSKVGSDTYKYSGTGGSREYPWAKIQHAVNWIKRSGASGDDIFIRSGAYLEQLDLKGISGNSNNWSLICPYNGEDVLISSNTLADHTAPYDNYHGIIKITSSNSYLHISGLRLGWAGNDYNVLAVGEGLGHDLTHHLKISYCEVFNSSGSGFHINGGAGAHPNSWIRYVEICNNTVYNVNDGITKSTETVSPNECISISNIWWPEIHHNTLYNFGKEGIDVKSGTKSGSIHDNIILNNRHSPKFDWNYNHVSIYCDGMYSEVKNMDIYNNYISSNSGAGITVGSEEAGGGSYNIDIYNNEIIIQKSWEHSSPNFTALATPNEPATDNAYLSSMRFYNNSIFTDSDGCVQINGDPQYVTDNHIMNNIFLVAGNGSDSFVVVNLDNSQSGGRIEFSDNLYYRINSTTNLRFYWSGSYDNHYAGDDEYFGPRSIFKDPLYVASGSDLHRTNPLAPGIGSGNIKYISTYDKDNILRSYNGTYDIGAYEYDTSEPEEEQPASGNLGFYGIGRLRFYNLAGTSNRKISFMDV